MFNPALLVGAVLLAAAHLAVADSPAANPSDSADPGISAVALAPPADKTRVADPCADPELQPNSMPPTWNIQAVPVQCGALETDNLAVIETMPGGVLQSTLSTTAKYGFTPRVQLRWGLPGRISQRAGGTSPLTGTTDQAVGVMVHFRDQAGSMPDLALDYGFKIPTANPSKAFGSGYADHLLTFIASRDTGPYHFDFNFVGTLAGGPAGFDGAVQSGFGISRTFPRHLIGTVEAFGGSQPGTGERLGAFSAGASWGIRPWLALNGGCIRSYTPGSPAAQFMLGFIYTVRPRLHWSPIR